MMVLPRSIQGVVHVGRLLNQRICSTSNVSQIHTSPRVLHMLDARGKDTEEESKQLTKAEGRRFDKAKQEVGNEKAFRYAIAKYKSRIDKYDRGTVEFIYAAMERVKEFKVERNLAVYKEIISLLPEGKMVPRSSWQVEMMHYPKQQQCAIDVLDMMERHGVCPDDAFGYLLKDRFGVHAHAFRKYRRMMYWMPKFKHANPYPVPYELPEDPRDLARLALQRMCPDPMNKILDFDTNQLQSDDVLDETFVVSAQSPLQQELLIDHDPTKPVYVEGGFTEWLRHKSVTYFVLRSDRTSTFTVHQDNKEEQKDEKVYYTDFLQDIPFFSEKKQPNDIIKVPSIHEQEDGTILAMCVSGTGSKNSLVSWIKWLQETNPKLAHVPVIFTLKTPETGLQVVKGEEERRAELART